MLELTYNETTVKIELDQFYSHELKIAKLPNMGAGSIRISYTHELDTNKNNQSLLALLLILQNLQDRRKINEINIIFTYVPFSRMDKQDNQFEETLRPFLMLIEPLVDNFATVSVHSKNMFEAILRDKHYETEGESYRRALSRSKRGSLPLVAVDKGVLNRYGNYFDVRIDKVRVNGVITHQAIGEYDIHVVKANKEFIMVDDICSMGTTFINAGKLIKEINPEAKLYLYVQYMEGSALEAGLTKPLFEMFDEVHYEYVI